MNRLGLRCTFSFLLSYVLLLAGCSCSSSPQRQPIFGKVISTRPVQIVSLHPAPELNAPAVTTPVVDGAFRFSREEGPLPGNYRVVLTFADQMGGFPTGTKKEFVNSPAAPSSAPSPSPPPELSLTVPAEGQLEIDITVP